MSSPVTNVPQLQNDEEIDVSTNKPKSPAPSNPSPYATNYEINPKDINLEKEPIGTGAYGKVYKGKLHGKEVAVKKINTRFLDDKALVNFLKEVDIMCALRHPNIVLFMGAVTTPGNLQIITELLPRGSVADILRLHNPSHSGTTIDPHATKPSTLTSSHTPTNNLNSSNSSKPNQKLTFDMKMKFMKDCALGMNRLHCSRPPILHLDLKPANLLVDENYDVKIGDFGLSKVNLSGNNRGLLGSPAYMSPEMLLGQEYDEKTDIYSFGMVLYEVITEKEPYAGKFRDIKELTEAIVKQNARPAVDLKLFPPKIIKLLKECWDTVPHKRPSFEEILNSGVLENAISDFIIKDKMGCDFWIKSFGATTDQVTWGAFETAFLKYFNYHQAVDTKNETKLFVLKTLLTNNYTILLSSKDDAKSGAGGYTQGGATPNSSIHSSGNEELTVTMANWAKILECFGPWKGTDVIENISTMLKEPWFHGEMNEKEAEVVLMTAQPGSFLVRFSSVPGSYTITLKGKDKKLAHYRVIHVAGGNYIVKGNDMSEFSTLQATIKAAKKKLMMKKVVKCTKFADILDRNLRDMH